MAWTASQAADSAADAASRVAWIMLLGLAARLFLEFRRRTFLTGLRTEFVCLLALYALTLAEFLFETPFLERLTPLESTRAALEVVLLGFSALALGGSLSGSRGRARLGLVRELTGRELVLVVMALTFVGHFYALLAVNFDPVRLFEASLGPRFAVPWGRGRLGGWRSLLNEIGMLAFLVPPLAAMAWHRRRQIPSSGLAVVGGCLAFTLFFGFCGGTRSVMAAHLATLTAGYLLARPGGSNVRQIVVAGLAALGGLYVASSLMIAFRNRGLGRLLQERSAVEVITTPSQVDLNLVAIAGLTEVFPSRYAFLGWEIPYWALIKPIPRAIWRGKPEGLSVGIEEALGAEGLTIAVTWVGEAYMSAGLLGVLAFGLVLGALAARWDRVRDRATTTLEIAAYASGFFAAATCMRSVIWLTTNMLPTVAIMLLIASRRRKQAPARARAPGSPPPGFPGEPGPAPGPWSPPSLQPGPPARRR